MKPKISFLIFVAVFLSLSFLPQEAEANQNDVYSLINGTTVVAPNSQTNFLRTTNITNGKNVESYLVEISMEQVAVTVDVYLNSSLCGTFTASLGSMASVDCTHRANVSFLQGTSNVTFENNNLVTGVTLSAKIIINSQQTIGLGDLNNSIYNVNQTVVDEANKTRFNLSIMVNNARDTIVAFVDTIEEVLNSLDTYIRVTFTNQVNTNTTQILTSQQNLNSTLHNAHSSNYTELSRQINLTGDQVPLDVWSHSNRNLTLLNWSIYTN